MCTRLIVFVGLLTALLAGAREVRLVGGSVLTGASASARVELQAEGNENALIFTVAVDPALLQTPVVALGPDAATATLLVNDTQAAQGRLGIGLALPAGAVFPAGTCRLLTITWSSAAVTTQTAATVQFTDTPVARELCDAQAVLLDGVWQDSTITISPIRRQPDLRIRTSQESSYTGDNVYNDPIQNKAQTVASKRMASYLFYLQNDGNVWDGFALKLTGLKTGWKVQTFDDAGKEVTAALTGAGWNWPAIAPGGYRYFRVQVTPTTAAGGTSLPLTLTARSVGDTAAVDALIMTTTVQPSRKSDVKLRVGKETTYIGDNLYSIDGAAQTRDLTCPRGATVFGYLKAQNDGNLTDTLRVIGPGSAAGWLVRYFEFTTNAEITTQVTGTGYLLPDLPVNGEKGIYLKITASPGVAPGVSHALVLQAAPDGALEAKDVGVIRVVSP